MILSKHRALFTTHKSYVENIKMTLKRVNESFSLKILTQLFNQTASKSAE